MVWKSCINKKKISLPKNAFDLYTSSSLHVKPVRGIPRLLIFVVVMVVLSVILGSIAFVRITKRIAPAPATAPAVGQPVTQNTSAAPPAGAQRQIDDRVDWIPRISNRPETAPAYDHLRVVVAMPIVTGAICINDKCKCLTNQGTNAGLSPDECRAWTTNRPFNPYAVAASENPLAHSQNPAYSGAGQAAGFAKSGVGSGVVSVGAL
jgi:zona occludens toxin